MLTDVTRDALEHICFNMRAIDKPEVFGVLEHDNPYRLAWDAYHMVLNKGRGRIAWHKGRPAAIIAFTERWPGMWEVWAFGTDHFKDAAIDLLRWARKEARDILETHGGHRLQCDSRVGHEEAHKMLRALGAKPEGEPMQGYGKDGAPYQRFVWLRERDSAVLQPGYVRAA